MSPSRGLNPVIWGDAYVTLGLFFGVITFTVTLTGLVLSIGLLQDAHKSEH